MGKPEIRFKGYTDEWEQRKLGDIATFINGRAYSQDELLSSGKYKVLRVGNFYTNDSWYYSDMELDDKYYAEKGDLLYTWSATFGPHIWRGDKVIYHYHIWKIELSKALEKSFALQLLEQDKQAILSDKNGSTMVHITKAGMEGKEVLLPRNINEQAKIGNYFSTLDNFITLHQRKCDEVKSLKKYMLQKMFPQNEQKVPEIRFKGFTEAWEQRKFSDIVARESSVCTSESDIPSVEYEDVIAEEGRLNKDIRSKEAIKSGIIFDGSQVLYGKLRPYLHNWLNPDFKGVAVGDWWVLKPIVMDKNFLYRLIQTQQFDNIANQSSGSKMPRADWNLISNSKFMVPLSKEEQSKIGRYFDSLDTLITLHQQKCEELKKIKKFMLQKMFV